MKDKYNAYNKDLWWKLRRKYIPFFECILFISALIARKRAKIAISPEYPGDHWGPRAAPHPHPPHPRVFNSNNNALPTDSGQPTPHLLAGWRDSLVTWAARNTMEPFFSWRNELAAFHGVGCVSMAKTTPPGVFIGIVMWKLTAKQKQN